MRLGWDGMCPSVQQSSPRLLLRKSCACTVQPHQILRLPRKTEVKTSKLEFRRPKPTPQASACHESATQHVQSIAPATAKTTRCESIAPVTAKCNSHELPHLTQNCRHCESLALARKSEPAIYVLTQVLCLSRKTSPATSRDAKQSWRASKTIGFQVGHHIILQKIWGTACHKQIAPFDDM